MITPVHHQANGQVESLNKIIVNNLKKKLGTKKGKRAEELPFVLWADQTTSKNATTQTPFSFMFATEAMISTEMVILTTRSCLQNLETNNQDLANDLEVVDKYRDSAKFFIAAYQWSITKSYNINVRSMRNIRLVVEENTSNEL
ncbi:uncharacterized protein LOC143553459 [Bidens hawaiensis]|uniref:uncharacterized protein LOC143553459 n=1 Tax=Bidens hawaiensis TaxID=980011 RepID=UPI00404A4447